jgi:hypothetical protein
MEVVTRAEGIGKDISTNLHCRGCGACVAARIKGAEKGNKRIDTQDIVTLPDQAAIRWVGEFNVTIPEHLRYGCWREGGG